MRSVTQFCLSDLGVLLYLHMWRIPASCWIESVSSPLKILCGVTKANKPGAVESTWEHGKKSSCFPCIWCWPALGALICALTQCLLGKDMVLWECERETPSKTQAWETFKPNAFFFWQECLSVPFLLLKCIYLQSPAIKFHEKATIPPKTCSLVHFQSVQFCQLATFTLQHWISAKRQKDVKECPLVLHSQYLTGRHQFSFA